MWAFVAGPHATIYYLVMHCVCWPFAYCTLTTHPQLGCFSHTTQIYIKHHTHQLHIVWFSTTYATTRRYAAYSREEDSECQYMFDTYYIIDVIVEKCKRGAIKQRILLGLEVQIGWMLTRRIVHWASWRLTIQNQFELHMGLWASGLSSARVGGEGTTKVTTDTRVLCSDDYVTWVFTTARVISNIPQHLRCGK